MSILTAPENPYDFFNIRFPATEEFGQRQFKAFWLPTDVSYAEDGKDYESLSPSLKKVIKNTIGFFFSSDGIVFNNLGSNFKDEIRSPEVQFTYTAIEAIELIHAKSYGMQLDSIISDLNEKKELMMAIVNIPSIKKMADWAVEFTNKETHTLIDRLVAFLCVEGIFFSSPFAFIFWFRKYYPDKLKGIIAANDLISRDENLHCEFAVHLINLLGVNEKNAPNIFRSAVNVAIEFVNDTLTSDFLELNKELMAIHVKSVANRWAVMIGLPILYPDCKNTPFKFMENMSLEIKKNFFEKDATEYQKAPPLDINFDDEEEDF